MKNYHNAVFLNTKKNTIRIGLASIVKTLLPTVVILRAKRKLIFPKWRYKSTWEMNEGFGLDATRIPDLTIPKIAFRYHELRPH